MEADLISRLSPMFHRSAIQLLFIFFLSSICSYGRNTTYTIVNYNTDNGLPQNSINGIQFDRKGYCWLGTQMGLVRFDGQQFSVFGSDNIKGLRSDRIPNVSCDTAGNVFASTGGIVNVLRINDSGSSYASGPILLSPAELNIPRGGFVVPFSFFRAIKADPAFELTFGTAGGCMYLIQSKNSFYITPHGKIPLHFNGPYQIHRTLLIGETLIALEPQKVSAWTKGLKQPTPDLRGPLWNNPDFKKGNFLVPYSTNGGYVYAGKTFYRLSFVNNVLLSEEVLDNIDIPAVSCLNFDKQHNKWYIGSYVSGLFIITPTAFHTPPAPDYAVKQGFYSQAVINEGILSQQVLFRKDGTYKEYPITPNLKATFYRPETQSLYYAPGLALLRFDLATEKTYHLADLQTSLSSVFPDPWQKEVLVFSTSFSVGKMIRDRLICEKTIPYLKKGQELFASYPAGPDTFLLATWSGMKWYDFRNNVVYRSILDSLAIRQLYPESPQCIWIASYGKGWYVYRNGHISRLPDGPFEALKTVNAIIDDGRGYFWLSSNNGLYKVSKQALLNYSEGRSEDVYFYSFTTKDYLPANEFNACNPSYVWLPDSMLSLPSIKGLVWFYPHKMQVSLPDKGIYIEHIYINQKELQMAGAPLVLNPEGCRLDLKISSPYFGNKENMQLQYRIEGLDNEWHPVPASGEITIDRIPAGNFSLVARKISGMEEGQYTRLILPIEVRPFWYHTKLFYLAMFLFAAALVYRIMRLRTRLLQARNRKLQMQVMLQTRDLNLMVHRLTQSEEALKQSNQTKNNIITTVLHDLRSPIRFIHMISKWVANDHTQMKPETLEQHLEELKNSTASLNSFTDQFFTWALSQHDTFSASYTLVHLQQLFNEIEVLYTDIARANDNTLVITPTDIRCYTDLHLLSTVIRNLLDNANKNTINGTLTIAAQLIKDKIVITVSDTGKGFTAGELQIFLDKTKTDRRKGNGSFIMLQLLDIIEGHLEASSEKNRGTTFRIVIPRRDEAPDDKQAG